VAACGHDGGRRWLGCPFLRGVQGEGVEMKEGACPPGAGAHPYRLPGRREQVEGRDRPGWRARALPPYGAGEGVGGEEDNVGSGPG
jgi:hypothetical protein